MANERLRQTISAAGLTVEDLAQRVSVDPKTVERWISTGRVPHRRHRWYTAKVLDAEESYLWPETLDEEPARAAAAAEVVDIYPHRGAEE